MDAKHIQEGGHPVKQRYRRSFSRRRKESGTVAVLVALCLIVIVGFLALALDIGYVMITRNESQDAADAAALAGARRLGENYYTRVTDKTTDVVSASETTAGLNEVATQNVSQDNVDIKIGWWDQVSGAFTETAVTPNAVQATVTRRPGLTNGPIRTFVAGVVGIPSFQMGATATATILGECTGLVDFPIGIGRSWFTRVGANRGCTTVVLNRTMSSCAGYTNLQDEKYKWKQVEDIITKRTSVPVVNVGGFIEFGGGTVEALLTQVYDRFAEEAAKGNVPWRVTIPVFEDNDVCKNPTERSEVIGFATMDIENVILGGNAQGLYGRIVCEEANLARGTCFYAGTYGAIPGLVK
jgi:Flp pilus assembly protein TadG